MQTCPGFFLKSLLESPGNLLEICAVKFVDTLGVNTDQFVLYNICVCENYEYFCTHKTKHVVIIL